MLESSQDCDRIFPVSQSQRNIWELERLYPNSPMNNICTSIRIKGRIDVSLVTKCINYVLERDLSLRTRMAVINGKPCQFYAPHKDEKFPFYDFSMTDEDGITRWENTIAQIAMPVCESPLCQFFIYKYDEKSGGILMKLHHIICDGWSVVDLSNRLSSVYLAFLSGEDPGLEMMPGYDQHITREKEYLVSEAFKKDKDYWVKQIEKFNGERAYLKKSAGAYVSNAGERCTFKFSEVLNHAIAIFCNENRIAPFTLFSIALGVHLKRISDCSDVCFGVPVMNRPDFEDKLTGGMFVNTLPFFMRVDTSLCVEDAVIKMTEEWYDLLRHQKFPFSEIAALSHQLNQSEGGLFDIALSYQEGKIFRSGQATLVFSGKWLYSGYQNEHLVIHLSSLDGTNRFAVDYDYLTQVYSREDIEDLHRHVLKILSELLLHQKTPIQELEMLDDIDLEKVLYTFNNAGSEYVFPTVAELLMDVVKKTPHTVALICDGNKITYQELYERIINIAAHIREACAEFKEKENIVALCLPRGFDLIASMLAVSFSGNAWMILPSDIPKTRLSNLLSDSGAAALLTVSETDPLIYNGRVKTLFLDNLPKAKKLDGLPVQLDGNDLAYVVYTSGSTGKPKGVMIEQSSLTNFAKLMEEVYPNGGVLSLCNTGFDVFILETVAALLCGRTVILPLDSQHNDPLAIAELIEKYAVNFFAITPSRLETYVINPQFARALKNMESIVCGGEQLTGDFVRKIEKLTKARIYNQYGPSETTIGVSCKCVSQSPSLSAGKPMANCCLYVLDENLKPLPVGGVGDLYIGGVCVGRGYLGNEEATKANFLIDKFEINQRMYRSGDTAKWDKNGEINIIGRRDSQVKLNGNRIEPQEIASALRSHPMIEQTTVNIIKKGKGGYIAAYYVSEKEIDESKLYAYCGDLLPAYMIPQTFIRLKEMPLTPNGKTDMVRLPMPEVKNVEKTVASKTQEMILGVFESVLDRNDLTVNSSFFQSGGDSLSALAVIAQISKLTGFELKASELRGMATPVSIAERIDGGLFSSLEVKKAENKIKPTERESYPLTAIQKSILFSAFSDPNGIAYNMPGGFALPFELDVDKLENAFRQLIEAEDILRTAFVFEKAEAVAKVKMSVHFELEKISAGSYKEAFKSFARPFDLTKPPLIRAGLWQSKGENILLLDIHHIINDGEGTPIILNKLDTLYRGEELVSNGLSYKDYAYYMQENDALAKPMQYWNEKLKNFGGKLALPTDFPRGESAFDCKGKHISFKMEKDLSAQVNKFCSENSITPFTLFVSAYGIMLSEISGKKDIVIGTPVAGRIMPETRDMTGAFINTLPFRFKFEEEVIVSECLKTVSNDASEMLENPYFDQEKFKSGLGKERGGLYSVMFSMRPAYENVFKLNGQKIEYVQMETGTAKMDIVFEAVKNGKNYEFIFEYAASLFKKETMDIYAQKIFGIIDDLIQNSDKKLKEILKVSEINADNRNTIDEMADSFAVLTPDSDAIVFRGEHMSCGKFKERSDNIAAQLVESGVKRGDVVGLYCDRTPDLLCSMFGAMKAGAAYLPLSYQLPTERIYQMLDVAGVKTVLCDKETDEIDGEKYCKCVVSDEIYSFTPVLGRSVNDVAQVMFTSGSTGEPKGIMISHRSIKSLLPLLKKMYDDSGVKNGVLCSSNAIFDALTMEAIIPLATGLKVVLADLDELMTPWLLAKVIKDNDAQAMFATPSRMRALLGDDSFTKAMSGMKTLLVGGEAMTESLAEKLLLACKNHVYNIYGPTETTAFVTSSRMTDEITTTLGYSLANAEIYVLDENMNLCEPMVSGEMYIGGECLAEGYIGRPELTKAAFVPNPFVPGKKLYKTGDMASLSDDRKINFIGRKDFQVKLNGQRIELEEIAGSMINTGLVADAVVAMIKNQNEEFGSMLRGYVVLKDGVKFDEKVLREEIGKKLPKYMIPSEIVTISAIPLTPTGKTDMKALIAMDALEVKTQENEEEMPIIKIDKNDRKAVREVLISLWKEILTSEKIDENRSFFEQGGTSLACMNLIVQYFKYGWQFKLGDFYDNPTLKEQLDFISPVREIEMPKEIKSHQDEAVLVTGATGFLGAHIVYELINDGYDEVYCLVRTDKFRIYETLTYYFGKNWMNDKYDKIFPIQGDISESELGLSKREYLELAAKIEKVFHCAADVRHYMNEEDATRANVGGTQNVIKFCREAGAYLGSVSTLSVGGERICRQYEQHYLGRREVVFDESCFDIGQNWRDNVYVRSKFYAEYEVKKACDEGLKAKILRVGRLVGRANDGKFQSNRETNYFYNVIAGGLKLGAIPEEVCDMTIDLTQIDKCARAAVLIMNGESGVAHLSNPNTVKIEEVFETLAHRDEARVGNSKMKILQTTDFKDAVVGDSSVEIMQSASLLNSSLNIGDPNVIRVKIVGNETNKKLEKLGFKWEKPEIDVVLKEFIE